jgi:hypothetical protein
MNLLTEMNLLKDKEENLIWDFCESYNLIHEPNNAQEDLKKVLYKYKLFLLETLETQIQNIDPINFEIMDLYKIIDMLKKT